MVYPHGNSIWKGSTTVYARAEPTGALGRGFGRRPGPHRRRGRRAGGRPVGAGICHAGGRGPRRFSLEGLVDATVPQNETISVTATVPGVRTADALWCPTTTFDPAPENNTATTTFTVSGPADISVAASGSPDPVPLGGDL